MKNGDEGGESLLKLPLVTDTGLCRQAMMLTVGGD